MTEVQLPVSFRMTEVLYTVMAHWYGKTSYSALCAYAHACGCTSGTPSKVITLCHAQPRGVTLQEPICLIKVGMLLHA